MSELSDPDNMRPGEPPVSPEAVPSPDAVPGREPGAAPAERRNALPVLAAIGFLLLLAGLVWLWRETATLQNRIVALEQPAAPAVDPARIASLSSAVDGLRSQVAKLAARPRPTQVDLAPIEQRLSALEHRPGPPPAPDLAAALKPIEAQIAALEDKSSLKPLEARIAALENKPAVKPENPALQAQVQNLAAAQKATEQQAEAAAKAAQASAARAAELQKVQQAEAALRAGKPLGELSGAPPALARFATVAPPTEAALRLSFPEAAGKAAKASEPSTGGLSFAQRMWQRAEGLVTVRQGHRVVVGAPASATLAAARARLEAGDLAGAVATLGKLDPAAAQAMAPWREQAQALLDARAALANMAAG